MADIQVEVKLTGVAAIRSVITELAISLAYGAAANPCTHPHTLTQRRLCTQGRSLSDNVERGCVI